PDPLPGLLYWLSTLCRVVGCWLKSCHFDLFFFLMIRRHPISTLFPYTTLFRSGLGAALIQYIVFYFQIEEVNAQIANLMQTPGLDRKSTRLNSSHVKISYAVFCLKKKI